MRVGSRSGRSAIGRGVSACREPGRETSAPGLERILRGPPGTPPWPPGAPAAPHRARALAAARSRPRGGAGRGTSPRAAPRTRRGSPVPGRRNPARPAPGPGPQISSPGGRGHSAGRPSPCPPRPLAAAAGTRPGARGGPSGPPYARSGPPPAVSPGSRARAAPFPLAARESRDYGVPWGDAAAVPALSQSARLVAWLGGGGRLLSPRCAPPATFELSSRLRKNAACTHLFIYFATAARHNEAFQEPGQRALQPRCCCFQ